MEDLTRTIREILHREFEYEIMSKEFDKASEIISEKVKYVISKLLPTDKEIEELMTTVHYSQDIGRYRRLRLDRIEGGKKVKRLIIERLNDM